MLYREAGQYKTNYAADVSVFPLREDRVGLAVILFLAFCVVPFISNGFMLQAVLIPFLVFSLAAIALNILTGYTGLISLGTGAFMGVGAYACYKLTTIFPQVNVIIPWLYNYNTSGAIEVPTRTMFGVPITGATATPQVRYLVVLAVVVLMTWLA